MILLDGFEPGRSRVLQVILDEFQMNGRHDALGTRFWRGGFHNRLDSLPPASPEDSSSSTVPGRIRGPSGSFVPFPFTLTPSLRERSPRTLCAPWTPGPQDVPPFLPLFPTQEGGEGWGEEECLFWITPLSGSLPARASRGEREKKSLLKLRFMGGEQRASDGRSANWANSGKVVIERRWTILPLPNGE